MLPSYSAVVAALRPPPVVSRAASRSLADSVEAVYRKVLDIDKTQVEGHKILDARVQEIGVAVAHLDKTVTGTKTSLSTMGSIVARLTNRIQALEDRPTAAVAVGGPTAICS